METLADHGYRVVHEACPTCGGGLRWVKEGRYYRDWACVDCPSAGGSRWNVPGVHR